MRKISMSEMETKVKKLALSLRNSKKKNKDLTARNKILDARFIQAKREFIDAKHLLTLSEEKLRLVLSTEDAIKSLEELHASNLKLRKMVFDAWYDFSIISHSHELGCQCTSCLAREKNKKLFMEASNRKDHQK